jgi:hypothetical protein
VLFAPDEGARAAMLEGLSGRGFFAVPLAVEPGLRGEAAPASSLLAWL